MQSQALSLEAPAGAVEGVLTYLAPTERRPFTYNYSPPPAGEPRGARQQPDALVVADRRRIESGPLGDGADGQCGGGSDG